MIAAAAVFAVALVAIVYLMLRHHAQAQAQWATERRELLNRIQRPELVPVGQPAFFEFPEPEVDESGLVGTITFPDSEEGENERH